MACAFTHMLSVKKIVKTKRGYNSSFLNETKVLLWHPLYLCVQKSSSYVNIGRTYAYSYSGYAWIWLKIIVLCGGEHKLDEMSICLPVVLLSLFFIQLRYANSVATSAFSVVAFLLDLGFCSLTRHLLICPLLFAK